MLLCLMLAQSVPVALLAEGVDRNIPNLLYYDSKDLVALLAEGVDRNRRKTLWLAKQAASPSSRRAWIEIFWLI